MTKVVTGIIHGKTIELDHATGLADGQRVEVEVRTPESGDSTEGGLRRCAGALADMPDSVDDDLRTILDSRKSARFREVQP